MTLFVIAAWVLLAELTLSFSLPVVRRLGPAGARLSEAACRAPGLDLLVGLFTLAPPIAGAAVASWTGLAGALLGQIIALQLWILIHEQIHREAARGVRLVKAQNAVAGKWRNHTALWFSVLALPLFWTLRISEILLYPPLRWLLRFPGYRQGEWVNVSRHKFESLVGHDLIWCLYCDWMTGIYSFGGEMLRNVESFWCPIRFYDGKKCENCQVDFPDVNLWATPGPDLADAVSLFHEKYDVGDRSWFGHPARLTLNGAQIESTPAAPDPCCKATREDSQGCGCDNPPGADQKASRTGPDAEGPGKDG